jgi:hypothetical protein
MASEIRVTNIKANDGTASLTVANSNGNVTNAGTFTSTGAITASGGIANAGTISAGTLGASVVATDLVVNLPTYASVPFATSTITQSASTYVKVGLLNQTDRVYMPKKTGFSVDASTDEIIVANAGTYIMSSTTFTVGAASSRENQLRWIVKNAATPSAYNDGTLIQWWYYVNAGTNNSGTTEYISSGVTSIVELAANDHLQLWGLCIYGTQTISQNTDYGKSHVSFIKIK